MPEKLSFFDDLRAQLEAELERDSQAVIKGLRGEFESHTVEVQGQEATKYLQQTWLEGKGLRNPDEIDRIGPDEWWKQYFEHIGTNITPVGKDIFMASIKAGVDYTEAIRFSTILGGMEPDPPPQPVMPEQPFTAPEMMAPPPAPPMPEPAPPPEMAPPMPQSGVG